MTNSLPSPKSACRRFYPAAIALGAGAGIAIGVATHNVAVGVGIGAALALIFNIVFTKKNA